MKKSLGCSSATSTDEETSDEAAASVETLLEACDRKLQSLPKAVALQRDAAARATRQSLETNEAGAIVGRHAQQIPVQRIRPVVREPAAVPDALR